MNEKNMILNIVFFLYFMVIDEIGYIVVIEFYNGLLIVKDNYVYILINEFKLDWYLFNLRNYVFLML